MVRIATGREVIVEKTFIRPDGTETTPDEYFKKNRANVVPRGNSSKNAEGKEAEGTH